jgi:UPF0716 protein FxsA
MALLVIFFIVIPIAELYVIIQVGQAIGLIPTLAILLADALLGSLLLRHQGRSAWRRFNEALEQRRFPGKEVADGVMITFGGALLLTPGFITDIAGLALLIPPSRAVIRRIGYSFFGRRFKLVGGAASWGYGRMGPKSGPSAPGGPGPRGGQPYDVEGSAEEVPGEGTQGPRSDRQELPPA